MFSEIDPKYSMVANHCLGATRGNQCAIGKNQLHFLTNRSSWVSQKIGSLSYSKKIRVVAPTRRGVGRFSRGRPCTSLGRDRVALHFIHAMQPGW